MEEGGKWMTGLGLGFTNPVGTGGSVRRVSMFWLRWCRWGVGRGLGPGSGGVGWFYVCVRFEFELSVLMAGTCICVLCLADTWASEVHPVFNPVAPYGYLLPNMYLFIADITNPNSFV